MQRCAAVLPRGVIELRPAGLRRCHRPLQSTLTLHWVSMIVIPAKAGHPAMDTGFRRYDKKEKLAGWNVPPGLFLLFVIPANPGIHGGVAGMTKRRNKPGGTFPVRT